MNNDQVNEENLIDLDLIQFEEIKPQKLTATLNKLRNAVGNYLIKIGNKIKKD